MMTKFVKKLYKKKNESVEKFNTQKKEERERERERKDGSNINEKKNDGMNQ